jgi:hypothetical protein
VPDFVEFLTADGAVVRVEGMSTGRAGVSGMQPVGRGGQAAVRRAAETFETALGSIRAAAEAALVALRGGRLEPDEVELEFGVTLTAEAGALLARSQADAHLTVRLVWRAPADRPAA